jgi:ABC-type histidine transport system ATPase subunit
VDKLIVRDLATKGMTMVLAAHEMGFAREMADKVCFLQEGFAYEEGPPLRPSGARRASEPRCSSGESSTPGDSEPQRYRRSQ